MNYLEFEKPLAEIEGKAEELRAMARTNSGMDVSKEAEALDRKAETLLKDLYKDLTPWRKCQVARHPDRPHCKDYIDALFTEYHARWRATGTLPTITPSWAGWRGSTISRWW